MTGFRLPSYMALRSSFIVEESGRSWPYVSMPSVHCLHHDADSRMTSSSSPPLHSLWRFLSETIWWNIVCCHILRCGIWWLIHQISFPVSKLSSQLANWPSPHSYVLINLLPLNINHENTPCLLWGLDNQRGFPCQVNRLRGNCWSKLNCRLKVHHFKKSVLQKRNAAQQEKWMSNTSNNTSTAPFTEYIKCNVKN